MSTERKQWSQRWYVWVGALVVLVAVFFGVRGATRDRQPVRAVRVVRTELINTVSTNGRVEPESKNEVQAPLSAQVKLVNVLPGDVVKAGQLLMQLDDVEARAKVATAESGVKSAEAALEATLQNGTQQERQQSASDVARARIERNQAQRDVDALVKLKATGAASGSEVAAARQRLESAESNLKSAEENAQHRYSAAEVARSKAALQEAEANLAAARQVLARTQVFAPISGTVYSVNVGRTEMAEEGKPLLEMADLGHERVRAYFDEPEIGRLAVGQKIQIKWDAKPGRVWNGHIIRTPVTVIAFGTRNVGEVLIQIDDPDGTLLPETNVTVTVTTSSEANLLAVPREALMAEKGKYFVYRVIDNMLKRTPVTIGTISLTQVAILSGLQEGDVVATGTSNGLTLNEGVPIKAELR